MKLRTYLDAHRISADKFAAQAGVSSSIVYKWRAGSRKKPKKFTIAKIAKLTRGRVAERDWK